MLTLLHVGFGNCLAFGIALGLVVPWSIEIVGYQRDDARLGVLSAAIGVGRFAGAAFSRLFTDERVRRRTPASLVWSALASTTFLVTAAYVGASVVMATAAIGACVALRSQDTPSCATHPNESVST